VQARRVDESQQSVPLAISTITADRLRNAVVSSTDDIQRLVPNLQINQTTTGQLDFIIRGSFAGFGVDPSVVTYIDDVPQDSRVIVYGLFDLSSVQELKGPQGTLFGRNSTGGAVLFRSVRPKLDEVGGYADLRVGNMAERRFEGAINLPITSKLAARIAGEVERRDGTFQSVTQPDLQYDNRRNEAVRASLLWKPTDGIEDYLQATHYRVDEHRSPFIAVSLAGPCTSPVTPAVACLFQPPFNALLGTDNLRDYFDQQQGLPFGKTVNNDPVADDQRRDSVTNGLTIGFGGVTFRNTTYYGRIRSFISRDYDGTPARVVNGSTDDTERTFYNESQLLGNAFDDRLKWQFGGVFNRDRGSVLQYQNVFPLAGSLVTPRLASSHTNFRSIALYGQLEVDLSQFLKGLSLTAGYRYTWDDRRVETTAFSGPSTTVCSLQTLPVPASGPVPFPNTSLADCTRRLHLSNSDDNYNFTLQWKPVDRVLLYAATRKGYKTGSFNVLAIDPALAQYAPEVVHDVELGIKTDWKIGRVPFRVNAALFQAKYNNVQTSLTLVDPVSGSVTAVTLNQDAVTGLSNKATIKGFEVEATVVPFKPLQISAFYSMTDARYDRFFTISPRLDLRGQKVGGSIPETAGATAQLSLPSSGMFSRFNAVASYYWRARPESNASSVLTAAPGRGYSQLDARVSFSGLFVPGLELAAFVKNLTNKRDVLSNNIVSGEVTNRFTEPRTYGLDLTFRFGSER
jgi:iron complex outermembrane receptor protein